MGLFNFGDDSQQFQAYQQVQQGEHKSSWSHELIAGAAAFEAARAYEKHVAQNGPPPNHQLAKVRQIFRVTVPATRANGLTFGPRASCSPDLLELKPTSSSKLTASLDFIDRERAQHQAREQAMQAVSMGFFLQSKELREALPHVATHTVVANGRHKPVPTFASFFSVVLAPVTFTPRHEQPVTFETLRQLEPELLTAEVGRLQNSIQHLERSNAELEEFAATEDDDDDRRELQLAVTENLQTIASQKERLVMIRLALQDKLGVDAGNAHYDLAESSKGRMSKTADGRDDATAPSGSGEAVANEQPGEDDEGMYL
ncbi:hypothetical protein OIV83_005907 [Microbotryomycetes sp. JL201]|nr:hypothetical protein OIV83_005907 [Microbotryomycetes sp. JL201]